MRPSAEVESTIGTAQRTQTKPLKLGWFSVAMVAGTLLCCAHDLVAAAGINPGSFTTLIRICLHLVAQFGIPILAGLVLLVYPRLTWRWLKHDAWVYPFVLPTALLCVLFMLATLSIARTTWPLQVSLRLQEHHLREWFGMEMKLWKGVGWFDVNEVWTDDWGGTYYSIDFQHGWTLFFGPCEGIAHLPPHPKRPGPFELGRALTPLYGDWYRYRWLERDEML